MMNIVKPDTDKIMQVFDAGKLKLLTVDRIE